MGIIIMGPPGSGKGTQSYFISEACNIPHLSTGDILREKTEEDTEEGREIKGLIDKGNFVPDSKIAKIVKDKIQSIDTLYVLDGFPRTEPQADYVCDKNDIFDVKLVVFLRMSEEEAGERVLQRRFCPKCNTTVVSQCPVHPKGRMRRRKDDHPPALRASRALYTEKTVPAIKALQMKFVSIVIDATQDPSEIFQEINNYIKRLT